MGLMVQLTKAVRGAHLRILLLAFVMTLLAGGLSACRSSGGRSMTAENMVPTQLFLSAGDVLDISFFSATNFSGLRRIGPEGTITMPILGQVQASGKTAADLEVELEALYAKELQDPELFVNIAGSANVIYVSGSVRRPGRVTLDRPLTVLEGILEAGGFTPEANLKKVTVIRYEGIDNTTFELNLEGIYTGEPVAPFYLKPRDVVNVPAKVQWF
jgi:polysaccharide export outer membrane protein